MPLDPNTRHGRSPNKPLNVRLQPWGMRDRFHARAEECGTSASSLVSEFVAWWMGEPGALLPMPADDESRRAVG